MVVAAFAIDPSTPANVVVSQKNVGVWLSGDGGATLVGGGPFNTGFSSGPPNVLSLVFDQSRPGTLLAGDFYSGVYASTDGGRTWTGFPDTSMTGLTTRAVKDLAVGGGVVYATTQGGGVFRCGGPSVVPSPVRLAFPETVQGVASALQTITLHNTAATTRQVTGKTFGGSGDFTVSADGCTGALNGGAICTFGVVFTPSSAGIRTATLTVTSDDPISGSYQVALTGNGLPAPPASPTSPTAAKHSGGCASGEGAAGLGWCLALFAAVGRLLSRRRPSRGNPGRVDGSLTS